MKELGNQETAAINHIADDAFKLLHTLQSPDFESQEFVKIKNDTVQNITNGYLFLYELLMEYRAVPSLKNKRKFTRNYH